MIGLNNALAVRNHNAQHHMARNIPVENPQNIDERMIELYITAGTKLGDNRRALINELDGLDSQNRILVGEITHLKLFHADELNAAVDGFVAARNVIVEKLKAIIERLKAFPEKYKCCGYIPLDPTPLQSIINELVSKDLEPYQLRKYPEYSDKRLNKGIPQEESAIVPFSDIPLTLQSKPIIIKLTEEIEALEARVAPLRAENHALIEKKKIMIDFHGRHLEDLNQLQKSSMTKIVERVRVIYNAIKWEVNETVGQCSRCYDLYDGLAFLQRDKLRFAQATHKEMQQKINDKLNDVREHVLVAVKSLEALIL